MQGVCVNCGHPVEVNNGRVMHRGATNNVNGESMKYRQKLCWKSGCDCSDPQVEQEMEDGEEGCSL